jgi:hypothetical protein
MMRKAAAANGVPLDTRTPVRVVLELREHGDKAYPSLWGLNQRVPVIQIEGTQVVPLGGISRSITVFCNESGRYLVYRSDEHGFHNPPEIWKSEHLDVAVVGDSFAQGYCVPLDQDLVAVIRQQFANTISVGMAGNGPLKELASIKEYVAQAKPLDVLWLYYESNDLQDLKQEKSNGTLSRYLSEADFSQHLIDKQAAIDGALARRMDVQILDKKIEYQTLMAFLTLRNLRLRLQPTVFRETDEDYKLFRTVLSEADRTVKSWGGRLHFVYLPGWEHFNGQTARFEEMRLTLKQMTGELGIPFADVYETFQAQSDTSRFFVYAGSHYNAAGYSLAAQSVLSSEYARFLSTKSGNTAMNVQPGRNIGE